MCKSRFRRPINFSASVTHAHCNLWSSRKTHIDRRRCTSVVCWKFGTNVMQLIKFLKFQVGIISLDSQDPRILEILARSCVEGPATGWFIRSCVSLLSVQWPTRVKHIKTRKHISPYENKFQFTETNCIWRRKIQFKFQKHNSDFKNTTQI